MAKKFKVAFTFGKISFLVFRVEDILKTAKKRAESGDPCLHHLDDAIGKINDIKSIIESIDK